MTHQELVGLALEVVEISKKVGHFIKSEIDKVSSEDILLKDMNSLVSYVDTTAEKMFVKALSNLLPQSGFITEEGTASHLTQNEKVVWVIDPLDGTTNYLKRIPHYSSSIALMIDGELAIGVVSDISQDTYYHAIQGGGAFCNGKRIEVSPISALNEAILVTGFPYDRQDTFESLMRMLAYFLKHARGVRRLGSAALDLAYVASGRLDAYYEASLNIWDIAAGILLVKEAGGMVSDFNGGDNSLEKGEVIVANPKLHKAIEGVILSME